MFIVDRKWQRSWIAFTLVSLVVKRMFFVVEQEPHGRIRPSRRQELSTGQGCTMCYRPPMRLRLDISSRHERFARTQREDLFWPLQFSLWHLALARATTIRKSEYLAVVSTERFEILRVTRRATAKRSFIRSYGNSPANLIFCKQTPSGPMGIMFLTPSDCAPSALRLA